MTANDRRMAILQVLLDRKEETMSNLAFEFGVSRQTIYHDIIVLSCDYPIDTAKGHGGGVYIDKSYRLGMKYLTKAEKELLEKLSKGLDGQDSKTMRAILSKFSNPQNGGKN